MSEIKNRKSVTQLGLYPLQVTITYEFKGKTCDPKEKPGGSYLWRIHVMACRDSLDWGSTQTREKAEERARFRLGKICEDILQQLSASESEATS